MVPRLYLRSIHIHGKQIQLGPADIVIIVGSNNSGKSQLLRDILGLISATQAPGVVATKLEIGHEGTSTDLTNWLARISDQHTRTIANPTYVSNWGIIQHRDAQHEWDQHDHSPSLSSYFIKYLTTDDRIRGSDPSQNIPITQQRPTTPIQLIMWDDKIETLVNKWFKEAFDNELIVHRNCGTIIPLYVGINPERSEGEDRISARYLRALEALPTLQSQGDGMRSFATIALATATGYWSLLLIDEPEAFIHPPQVRVLARVLATEARDPQDESPLNRQLFLATHSGDLLRGLLSYSTNHVRVLRLSRNNGTSSISELNNLDIRKFWSDPLLRFSNLLDAIFHDKAVICESDSDCRFYEAVASATGAGRDVLFGHCGGKQRLHVAVAALRALAVPVAVIVDIDILNDEHVFNRLFTSCGGDWTAISACYKVIKNQVESGAFQKTRAEIVGDIKKALDDSTGDRLSGDIRSKINVALRETSPWNAIKKGGVHSFPQGDASRAFCELDRACRLRGLFIVPVGELERFCPHLSGHGPEWVINALGLDLLTEPSLRTAREFVNQVVQKPSPCE